MARLNWPRVLDKRTSQGYCVVSDASHLEAHIVQVFHVLDEAGSVGSDIFISIPAFKKFPLTLQPVVMASIDCCLDSPFHLGLQNDDFPV